MVTPDVRQLAFELTKLTLENRYSNHAKWMDLAQEPEKWKRFVQDLYKECVATVEGSSHRQ